MHNVAMQLFILNVKFLHQTYRKKSHLISLNADIYVYYYINI